MPSARTTRKPRKYASGAWAPEKLTIVAVKKKAAMAVEKWRLGQTAPLATDLLGDPDPAWRRRAALALAEAGDVHAGPVLVEYWGTSEAGGFTSVTSSDWLAHPGTVGRGGFMYDIVAMAPDLTPLVTVLQQQLGPPRQPGGWGWAGIIVRVMAISATGNC